MLKITELGRAWTHIPDGLALEPLQVSLPSRGGDTASQLFLEEQNGKRKHTGWCLVEDLEPPFFWLGLADSGQG